MLKPVWLRDFQNAYASSLTLADIDRLTGGAIRTIDIVCPWCGPQRRSPGNRHRKVLRVWRPDASFAAWYCARCDERGYLRDTSTKRIRPDYAAIARAKAEGIEREQIATMQKRATARWLWRNAQPITNTIGECYLRDCRGYSCPFPATLRFLPALMDYEPAIIAAFGLATEPEPGLLAIADANIVGVHLTKLEADGSGKADVEKPKIMIGRSRGTPIVLAPINDLFGLAITEGIEDGLSTLQSTGLGVWVAGSASRMPALADVVPDYTGCVSVVVDDDDEGRRQATALIARLRNRNIAVRPVQFNCGLN
jgi:hypothetical protein